MNRKYVDLGLPSGNLWAVENEPGYYTWDEAVEKFRDQLPTREDWKELLNHCEHEWDDERKGLRVYNNNGEIFLPAAGYRYGTTANNVGSYGIYWSSTAYSETNAYYLYFYSNCHWNTAYYYNRFYGFTVRLVKKKGQTNNGNHGK